MEIKNLQKVFLYRFIANKVNALDEIRKMAGFSKKELMSFFKVLNKCSYAHVNFERGNVEITIIAHCFSPAKNSNLHAFEIIAEVNTGQASTSIKYQLSQADLASYSVRFQRERE